MTVPCGVCAITSGMDWEPISGVVGDTSEVEKLEMVDARDPDLRTWIEK